MLHVDPATVAASRPAPAGPRALIERQMAMLTRLAEIGMEIAEAAGRAAVAAADGALATGRLGDPGLTYTRVARAVRLTLALQARLAEDLVRAERREASAQIDRRRRLHAVVERAIEADHGEADDHQFHQLLGDARERLTEAEEDAELDGLPFAEAVARICADLQLSPLWTARMVAAAGGYPGSPPVVTGGGPAESREGGEGAVTAGRGEAVAPSTTGACPRAGLWPDPGGGPPPPRRGGGGSDDTFLEWPPPGG